MSVDHYENFPVASWLCPPELRPAVRAIYRFARTADDLADEGDFGPEQRLRDLAFFRQGLEGAVQRAHHAAHDRWPGLFEDLMVQVRLHQLGEHHLHALLDAFVQDVAQPIYRDRAELLAYCSRSANPVGRLLLQLYRVGDQASVARSDAICTALQLINFWQDLSVDLPRGRIYLPWADAASHGIDLCAPGSLRDSPATQALVKDLCQWSNALMREGAPLALQLPGRAGWELRAVVQGAMRVLERIEKMDYRTLDRRPRLHAWDLPLLAWRVWRMGNAP
ncbi:MAG: squalene synthase HpnC [Aquabacterium sp.]